MASLDAGPTERAEPYSRLSDARTEAIQRLHRGWSYAVTTRASTDTRIAITAGRVPPAPEFPPTGRYRNSDAARLSAEIFPGRRNGSQRKSHPIHGLRSPHSPGRRRVVVTAPDDSGLEVRCDCEQR